MRCILQNGQKNRAYGLNGYPSMYQANRVQRYIFLYYKGSANCNEGELKEVPVYGYDYALFNDWPALYVVDIELDDFRQLDAVVLALRALIFHLQFLIQGIIGVLSPWSNNT